MATPVDPGATQPRTTMTSSMDNGVIKASKEKEARAQARERKGSEVSPSSPQLKTYLLAPSGEPC